jgi:hypothetical protein
MILNTEFSGWNCAGHSDCLLVSIFVVVDISDNLLLNAILEDRFNRILRYIRNL